MSGTPRETARGMTTPTRTITIVEALRDRAGWTQRQLAERAGLLPSVIEQHELRGVALTDHALLRLSQASSRSRARPPAPAPARASSTTPPPS